MDKKYETIDRIIEIGIYLYIFFMFLSKGEGIRNVLLFGNFALWLITLKYRKNLHLLKEPVSLLCWIYIGTSIFSVFFSIDPLYSFKELRGVPLKFILLFPVISTVIDSELKLKRVIHVIFFTTVFIVLIGYYSYFIYDIPLLKPNTPLMHTWHNRFANYLNTLLPFTFILFLIWGKIWSKVILILSLILSILALILSTSRGGYLAFFSIVCIWAFYLIQIKKYNPKKVLTSIIMVILTVGIFSWFSVPYFRERISLLPADLPTFHQRTEVWGPALHAFMQRPIFGWGYGREIFHRDEPYIETPYKRAPQKASHNTFVRILVHQGLIGFIPYFLIILVAIREFWKSVREKSDLSSYVLVACTSVIVGNYILHSMLIGLGSKLHYLAVVLSLGIAAKGLNESSHN